LSQPPGRPARPAEGFPETLGTERLVLRRLRESDRAAALAIRSDPDVWRMLHLDEPFDRAVASQRFDHHVRHWDVHGFGVWAVELRETGEVAGWLGPSHPDFIPELAQEIELGWTLGRPFWGRGLASEGARAAVDAVFAHLNPSRVISLIHPANHRSAAVAERLGMQHAQGARHPDMAEDLRVYALTRERAAALLPRPYGLLWFLSS
jgi:RimJ/RimL family protein N-acetyltransferase